MKMVIAIVQDKDSAKLMERLVAGGHRATKLASTGGFLREGNTTFLIGCADEEVDDVIGAIREVCHSREQLVTPLTPAGGPGDSYVPYPVEVTVGGATIFVLHVERFDKV
ncbi:MAG: cyclic-di-AMP receptor [Bacillota bacterium]|nr:cyclic-di-AMP receptor [Clostridiales bacterium]MDI3270423.1 cyclic-di-AMP receptor [Bacillota bacterium]